MASGANVPMVMLLVLQAYCTCAALNMQQSGWVAKHLHRPEGLETHRGRHLGEKTVKAVDNGLRASLIHPTYKTETENFTILQKIRQDVEMSKERARFLDARVRSTPYHHHKGRKMLDFVSQLQTTPGGYSMEISLGTPPQNFIALADTGSDLVWLQCTPCDLCFESSVSFDPSLSSTYDALACGPGCDALGQNQLVCAPNCQYTYAYGDQSTTQGDFSLETLTLNDVAGNPMTIPQFQFGCGRINNGTFTGTNGLVGLARGPISFPSQIAPYLNNSNKFSYCMLNRYDPDSERSPLFFGEAAVPTNSTIDINSTGILTPYKTTDVPFYYVNLIDIAIGGQPLMIPSTAFQIDNVTGNGGMIFDSGTTYTFLNSEAYQIVKTSFESALDPVYPKANTIDLTGLEVCYDISSFQSVNIPNVVFNFEGSDFDLPFDNIMTTFSIQGQGDVYMCLAILESSGISIFGNVQQQNFQVLYDEDNEKISWVPLDCKSL